MDLSNRMKAYEESSQFVLPRRLPLIIRCDGRAFHTYTRGMDKPFDDNLRHLMLETSKFLCEEISGAKLAYTQSDEISVIVTNDDTLETQPWFDNNYSKIVSITASMATGFFNANSPWDNIAQFDARAFVLPSITEVQNYLIYRQQDWIRNSIGLAARSKFSQKKLNGVKNEGLLEMLKTAGIDWNEYPAVHRHGGCVVKSTNGRGWKIDRNIPLFREDREYITSRLTPTIAVES